MKITVVGAGYVGLVSGACFAHVGNNVLCLDLDAERIAVLEGGGLPIHEPGLGEMIRRNVEDGRLRFTTDPREAAAHGTVQFIAVGTPPDQDGSADLKYVLEAARNIGRHMDGFRVVVDKSTVPVGTAEQVRQAIAAELQARGVAHAFHVVSNPEFLKEGAAIDDFARPDRIVIGADNEDAIRIMRQLYAPFERNHPKLMIMDVRSAELTKYAANAMLATRISFMNELALLAEAVGADIDAVRRGIGSDERIGSHFLYAGCGYGGSCFPKDVKALLRTACDFDRPLGVLQAVDAANHAQKQILSRKIEARFGPDLTGLVFALWGLAFKPNTDDLREAPSLVVLAELLARGATVRVFDPVAMQSARRTLGSPPRLVYASHSMTAVDGADALIVVTEWNEFRSPDFEHMKTIMRKPVLFDGRNIYDPDALRRLGFEYVGIGRT